MDKLIFHHSNVAGALSSSLDHVRPLCAMPRCLVLAERAAEAACPVATTIPLRLFIGY